MSTCSTCNGSGHNRAVEFLGQPLQPCPDCGGSGQSAKVERQRRALHETLTLVWQQPGECERLQPPQVCLTLGDVNLIMPPKYAVELAERIARMAGKADAIAEKLSR